MGPLGPWVGRVHLLLRCTEHNMCLSLSLFVTRGREGTFSIVMYLTLHGYIYKPNITTPKTREALSVTPRGSTIQVGCQNPTEQSQQFNLKFSTFSGLKCPEILGLGILDLED